MMIEALEGMEEAVLVGEQLVSDTRFADDQGLVTSTQNGLQRQIHKLNDTVKK